MQSKAELLTCIYVPYLYIAYIYSVISLGKVAFIVASSMPFCLGRSYADGRARASGYVLQTYCIQDALSSRALGPSAECKREQRYLAYAIQANIIIA